MTKKKTKILYDEEKFALEILSRTPNSISLREAGVLCRYYYDLGLDTKKVKQKITEFYSLYFPANQITDGLLLDVITQRNKLLSLKKSANIPITKKEIAILKKMPHKDYLVALYILFIVKLEKFQNINKKNNKKLKSFKYLLWHDIRSCALSVGISLTEKQGYEMLHRFYKVGFAEPTLIGDYNIISPILISGADSYNGKNIETVIEGKKDFVSQVKYYCVKCEKQTEKSKRHDFCKACYLEEKRKSTLRRVRKFREKEVLL